MILSEEASHPEAENMRARSMLRHTAGMSVLVGGPIACGLLEEDEHRVIGVIEEDGISFDPLVVPDTVRAGLPFTITVSTSGSSCLRPDGAATRVSELMASVTPYDVTPASGSICPADLRALSRAVTLVFGTPGVATVHLHGRGFSTPMITLEETAVVAP